MFTLYGEPGSPVAGDLLHLESLASRSSMHRWEIEPHVHPGLHQVIWLRDGEVRASIEAEMRHARGPLLVIVPAGAVHGFRFAPNSEGHVLTFSPSAVVEGDRAEAASALHRLFAQGHLLQLAADQLPRLGRLFDCLTDEFSQAEAQGSPQAIWLVRALVGRLALLHDQTSRSLQAPARAEHALFTRFLVLIEARYLEHWPVSKYADRLGLSPERLNRLVRAAVGRSALTVIQERLAREACRRLVYLAAPVSRIAFDLGFQDPAYFCRFVRRHTGSSPRAYRSRMSAGGSA
jgi:AraC family transcriptional activator of pobA